MNSSASTTSKTTVDEEALDPVLVSIRKVEAIRDFASDITPLRSDGFNLHSWVGEIEKTLSDLIDRERYLRGCSPGPLVKSEDKIARNLIYWTIPRELRSLINDTITARDAYKALQAQFLRNTRTSHMATLVDLFNFQTDVTEPQHITMLYDQMYKGMNELVASGFAINQDSLLGALFQIAVGRANSQLYTATSHLLDTKFLNDQQSISSHEVCAAARRQLEHWHNTIFDEGPIPTSNETMESFELHVEEEPNHTPSVNLPQSSQGPSPNVLPATNAVNPQQPTQCPAVTDQPQQHPVAGSSHARVDLPVTASTSSTKSSTLINQAATPVPSQPPGQSSQPSNANMTEKSNPADLSKASTAFTSSADPAAFKDLGTTGLLSFGKTSAPTAPKTASISSKSGTPSAATNTANLNPLCFGQSNTTGQPANANKPDRKHG